MSQTSLAQETKNINKQVGSDQQLSLMIPPKPDLLLLAQECVFIFVCDLLKKSRSSFYKFHVLDCQKIELAEC